MTVSPSDQTQYDLVIIGGGINGCGIARDAAGRGLKVLLAEKDDLAAATSSASTKLFHGGLRYLEFFEINLVRHALVERERLLAAMPHISWPMRFVLPISPEMRFDTETPVSRILSFVMPWMKGRRPRWLIRLGLFIYDHLGGRKLLPGTSKLDLQTDPEGAPLKPRFLTAYEYSDCWVQDARLVVLNARDAVETHGATVLTRTKVTDAQPENGGWCVTLDTAQGAQQIRAKAIVNAAGPWVEDVINGVTHDVVGTAGIRLVRGSHIVTPKLFDHEKAYFFQGADGRIIFAIPYEGEFTLIGTTDAEHGQADTKPRCSDEERDYLCRFASEYFERPVTPEDVVWTYSGVRPLYDDGARSATAATRDYVLRLNLSAGAPVVNIFGGKITTYRRLAEEVVDMLKDHLPVTGHWTAGAALPGGDFPVDGVPALIEDLCARYEFLTPDWAQRLVRCYGTDVAKIFGEAASLSDLGQHFGAGLYEAELRWLITHEFACTAEDVLWRRTKLGLKLTAAQSDLVENWLHNNT